MLIDLNTAIPLITAFGFMMGALLGVVVAAIFYSRFTNFRGTEDLYQLFIFLFEILFPAFFVTVLAIITITDIKKQIIPDRIILPAILISLLALVLFTLTKIIYLYYYLNLTTFGKYLLPPYTNYFQRHAILTAEPLLGGIAIGL